MLIFLYKKTHNKTGLKYLGQTKRDDPFSYPGSGTYWLQHPEEYGYDFSTELITAFDNYDDLKVAGKFWSRHWSVVESDEWANLIEEAGGSAQRRTVNESNTAKIKRIQDHLYKLQNGIPDRVSLRKSPSTWAKEVALAKQQWLDSFRQSGKPLRGKAFERAAITMGCLLNGQRVRAKSGTMRHQLGTYIGSSGDKEFALFDVFKKQTRVEFPRGVLVPVMPIQITRLTKEFRAPPI
jgi:hypothetical protein